MKAISGLLAYIIRYPPIYLLFGGVVLFAGVSLSIDGAGFVGIWPRIIIGLLVFLLPGCLIYVLAPTRDDWDLIEVIGYGFTYSMALITVLGLITRTLAWSIDTVELVWHSLNLCGFAIVLYKKRAVPSRSPTVNPSVVALLAIVFILTGLFAHSSVFAAPTTREQFREHAYVLGYLRDEPLGWSEPFYETGNLIADRDYLTYWTLAHALVVEISGAPILLARYFVNPFVVIVSIAGMYIFARNLGHRPKYALAYVVLGLLGLSLVAESTYQAGGTYFVLPMYDKVMAAYAMAPVAISTAYLCYSTRSRRAYIVFALSFLATVCVNPMLGGFSAAVILIWCLARVFTERGSRQKAIQFALLALALVLPSIILRIHTVARTAYNFSNASLSSTRSIVVSNSLNPFDSGNAFFAINPETAGDLTYLLSALLLLAVATSGLSSRSKLLLAFVTMTGIALIPYTAWIYGRLVISRHIIRALWLFPYGYMIGFLIEHGVAILARAIPGGLRFNRWLRTDRVLVSLLVLAAIITAHSLQFHYKADYSRDIVNAPKGDRDLLAIAAYIDSSHSDRVWVAASRELNREAIGLSWKVISLSRYNAVRMSYHSGLSIEQATKQLDDNLRLYSSAVSVEDKLAIIEEYGIDYLFFLNQYRWMVDALYQMDKERFELVYSGETMRLVRVHGRNIETQ